MTRHTESLSVESDRPSYVRGQRVLVTSVEEAGEVTVVFGNGAYYVLLDSGDTIACGESAMAPEDRS